MFWYEQPPNSWTPEDKAYINRLMGHIAEGLDGTNGVAIRNEVPDKPREGKIYYLKEDLSNGATEGYYVFINQVWRKIAFEPEIPLEQI